MSKVVNYKNIEQNRNILGHHIQIPICKERKGPLLLLMKQRPISSSFASWPFAQALEPHQSPIPTLLPQKTRSP